MNKEKNLVLGTYIGFIIALISNFIPSASVQMMGGLLFLLLLVMTYIWRAKSVKEGYRHTHMAYLIKSFWIGALFLIVGILLAVLLADHSVINAAVDSVGAGQFLTEDDINQILIDYTRRNLGVFIITLCPSLLYLGYRFVKGALLANKEEVIENFKNWF
ncbi:MAG: hypothetical protein MRY79_02245 [Alphaproteobacteria bacterium]|nr:hypothetical protein [Alphaproteobacteria bacterium]